MCGRQKGLTFIIHRMAKIKVGIIEDELVVAQSIINALEELGYETTEAAINYTEALEMIASEQPDILLVDIQLRGSKDGIELAWKVKEQLDIPFIFLTANADTATVERAKKLHPPAYLVKPFNKNDLYTAIEICMNNWSAMKSGKPSAEADSYMARDHIFIRQGKNFLKIKIDDILYLESDHIYINVHTLNNKLLVRSSMEEYIQTLGINRFPRIHRKYAVNISHVGAVNTENVTVNGVELPLSRTHHEEFFRLLGIS